MQIDKNSAAYKKYKEKYDPKSPANIKKEKERRAKRRKEWWANNWIAFSSLVVAVIALALSAIALLR